MTLSQKRLICVLQLSPNTSYSLWTSDKHCSYKKVCLKDFLLNSKRKSRSEKEKKKIVANHSTRVVSYSLILSNPLAKEGTLLLNLTFFMRKTIKFPIKRFSHIFPSLSLQFTSFFLLLLRISTQFAVARFIVGTGELSAIKL